jgi:hypothetical protein
MPSKEPKRLGRGKDFHSRIQKEWLDTAEGVIFPEKTIRRLTGRRGSVDIIECDKVFTGPAKRYRQIFY